MEQKELTQEQKKKIKTLFWSTTKHSALIGAKYGTLLFVTNFVVCLISALYLQSQAFAFIGGVMNAIFIFRAMNKETSAQRDRLREETKKILSE